MAKRFKTSQGGGCRDMAIVLGVAFISSVLAYAFFTTLFGTSSFSRDESHIALESSISKDSCCRGVQHLEFWGQVVVYGDVHSTNSSHECCAACKRHGGLTSEKLLCNSWVFCADQEKCGDKFKQVGFSSLYLLHFILLLCKFIAYPILGLVVKRPDLLQEI
jgi:hypothetical protein